MTITDKKLQELFNYCDKHSQNKYFKELEEIIKTELMQLSDEDKEKEIQTFITTLKNNNYLNESVKSVLKAASLGTILALSLINPSYAQMALNNIEIHNPITAKYESGKKGYDCVVKDNYGGYSYGKYQISTERRNGKPSTFDYFMKYAKTNDPNIEYQLRKAGGWEAANKGERVFIDKWCEMTYRKDFRTLYDQFLIDREFIPVYNRMDNSPYPEMHTITGWASTNRAVQAALHSTIIQHGKNGAYNIFVKVVENNKITTPEEFIKALYDYRKKKFSRYKTRYKNECNDILGYLDDDESKIV